MSKLLLSNNLTQKFTLTQQLRNSINILQYSTIELIEMVKSELEENPLLEQNEAEDFLEDSDNYVQPHVPIRQSSFDDSDDYINNIPSVLNVRDFLLQQTLHCHFNEIEQSVAEIIIHLINDDGFLEETIPDILNLVQKTIKCDIETINNVLSHVKNFDPFGIASGSIKEFLIMQLDLMNQEERSVFVAKEIINHDHLSINSLKLDFYKKNLGFELSEIKAALQLIHLLKIRPLDNWDEKNKENIEPELYIRNVNGKYKVYLFNSILTRLSINRDYSALIKENKKNAAYKSILNRLNEAKLLINSITHRNNTLLSVAQIIVDKQADFFSGGKELLKPLVINDISSEAGCHSSTVSRITTGKYIITPQGVFELKFFFSNVVNTVRGESKSSVAVKSIICNLIENEKAEYVYSDEDIVDILKSQNIYISRRTVSKYRDQLNIPSSYNRMKAKKILSPVTTDI